MSTRQLIHICFMLATITFMAACSPDDNSNVQKVNSNQSNSFGQTITSSVNKNARIGTVPDDVLVTVKLIADSRCPSDVVCVWEGRSEVTFNIEGVNSPVILCVGNTTSCDLNPYEFTIDGRNYKLALKDVTPYPTTTNGNEEKKALFSVERL